MRTRLAKLYIPVIPVFLYNEHLMFLYVNISFPSAAKPTRVIKVMFT